MDAVLAILLVAAFLGLLILLVSMLFMKPRQRGRERDDRWRFRWGPRD